VSQSPSLTLEATGPEAEALRERRKTFGAEGGTIGRAQQCEWVLVDDYVSRQHARVTYRDRQFYIEDTGSKSGVYVNDQRLPAGEPHPLQTGDRLLIEPYDIVVAGLAGIGAPSFGVTVPQPAGASPLPFPGIGAPPDQPVQSEVDPLKALFGEPGPVTPPRSVQPPPPLASMGGGVLKEVVAVAAPPPSAPPAPDPPAGGIPVDWNRRQASTSQAPPPPMPPPVPPLASLVEPPRASPVEPPRTPAVADVAERPQWGDRGRSSAGGAANRGQEPVESGPASGALDLGELLAGAGLQGRSITPEMARQLGQILRVVVAGVLDVLHARQQTKDAFRIRGTVIRSKGNNPLKHSADVNDALFNLFVKGGAGYLGPVEAFEDAFADVRNHQLAMLEGIRAAFGAMLERFDPDRLQEGFDRTSRSRKKGAFDKLKGTPDYWEMYRGWVQGLTRDADGSFRSLFGEVFSEAYEDQLQQLKARSRSRDDEP
jgi:type VI secretion system FHA domain protein